MNKSNSLLIVALVRGMPLAGSICRWPPPTGWQPVPQWLLDQLPSVGVDLQGRVAGVAVVDRVHLFDRVEVADDVGGGEAFARLDRSAADFLDHADVAALVTPGFGDDV